MDSENLQKNPGWGNPQINKAVLYVQRMTECLRKSMRGFLVLILSGWPYWRPDAEWPKV